VQTSIKACLGENGPHEVSVHQDRKDTQEINCLKSDFLTGIVVFWCWRQCFEVTKPGHHSLSMYHYPSRPLSLVI